MKKILKIQFEKGELVPLTFFNLNKMKKFTKTVVIPCFESNKYQTKLTSRKGIYKPISKFEL